MQTHYSYDKSDDDPIYTFTTDNGIDYKMTFLEDENLTVISDKEIPNVYTLILEKVSPEKAIIDIKVGNTVKHLLLSFFETKVNSLLYVCDSNDNKSKLRERKFRQWYSSSGLSDIIHKKDVSFVTDTTCIDTSYLLHKDHPNYENLVSLYTNSPELYSGIKCN